jgi:hypothetical protein
MVYAVLIPILVNGALYFLVQEVFGSTYENIYDIIFILGLANLLIGLAAFFKPVNSTNRLSPLQMVAVLRMPMDDNAAFVMAKDALDKHHDIKNPKQVSIFKFPTLIRHFIFIGLGIVAILVSIISYYV